MIDDSRSPIDALGAHLCPYSRHAYGDLLKRIIRISIVAESCYECLEIKRDRDRN